MDLLIRPAEPSDAETIQSVAPDWWGRPMESDMLSRFFLTHFRDTCLVAERDGNVAGFLIGFLSQTLVDEAYIRLIVVDPQRRGEGIGRALYERFFAIARQHGRCVIRCVTSPSNRASVAFHTRLGFAIEPQGHLVDGLPVCRDCHGRPGTDRIVFVRMLET